MGYVDTSMLKYVPKALNRLKHYVYKLPQYSPHPFSLIIFTKIRTQQIQNNNQHQLLPMNQISHIQSITGSFLYYARAMDFTMLTALNNIGTTQAKPTEYTKQEC